MESQASPFLYSELPNCFISYLDNDIAFSGFKVPRNGDRVVDTIVNQYLSLNNKRTIVINLVNISNIDSNYFKLNYLGFDYFQDTNQVIDLLFKELQLRESDVKNRGERLFHQVDILLVSEIMFFLMSILDLDFTKEGSTSFKLKKIIQTGKKYGIGIILGEYHDRFQDPIQIKKMKILAALFENRYESKLETKQFKLTKIEENLTNPTINIPYNQFQSFNNTEHQPFSRDYEFCLFTKKTDCFSKNQISTIKTFRIQHQLKLVPNGAIINKLQSVYE
jgi:hypothetical protein